ncbi:MAG: methylated-DNA--[Clostridia bacterium]|nr:methylated-DNA--[protein]-cysteine S-methyltransferase [Clostridia bacterium]
MKATHKNIDGCELYRSPIGTLVIEQTGRALTALRFEDELSSPIIPRPTELTALVCRQLDEYFAGVRRDFSDIPLDLRGTQFQLRVWNALLDIPYGETRNYGDIAAAVENPRACRAVGMANHNNPIVIIVPCHRVIGADGSLTGYGGGLDKKVFLLELERKSTSH